jgi:hypothetical protein
MMIWKWWKVNCSILILAQKSITLKFLTPYEKSCLPEPHYLTTRAPKQLLCNYIITRTWKYRWLIKRMQHQKIKKLYCDYNLFSNGTHIWCNVCIIHTNIVNHVWFFSKLHFNCVFTTSVNVAPN